MIYIKYYRSSFLLKLIASYCKKKTAFWKPYHDTWKLWSQTSVKIKITCSESKKHLSKTKRKVYFTKITTWKYEKYLTFWERKAPGRAPARLILTEKFSAWVYWKLFCPFWPIKLHNFAHMVLLTLFFPVNSTCLSLEWICDRFF